MRQSSVLGGLLVALSLLLLAPMPASAEILTEGRAEEVATRMAIRAYYATGWSEAYSDECSYRTPWREACWIEVLSLKQYGPDCWRNFEVVSPIFGSKLHLKNVQPWECEPYPAYDRLRS